jgi:hypothetical protein
MSDQQQKQEQSAAARIGEASEQQLAKWRQTARGVYEIEVKDGEGNTYVGYIKRPDRYVKDEVFGLANESRLIAAGEVIMRNCWLGGAEVLADSADEYNDLFDAACMAAFEAISMPDASAKKL